MSNHMSLSQDGQNDQKPHSPVLNSIKKEVERGEFNVVFENLSVFNQKNILPIILSTIFST